MTHHPHEHEGNDEPAALDQAESGGEVVPLDAARRRARRADDQKPDRDEDEFFDRETVVIEGTVLGPPVDPADDDVPYRSGNDRHRAPIIPATLRSWRGTRSMLVWAAKDAGYVVGYHAVRAPKYAAKAAVYAVPGLFRATAGCCTGPRPRRATGRCASTPPTVTTPRRGSSWIGSVSGSPAGAGRSWPPWPCWS